MFQSGSEYHKGLKLVQNCFKRVELVVVEIAKWNPLLKHIRTDEY